MNEFVSMHEETRIKRDVTHRKNSKYNNKVGNVHCA